MTRVLPMIAAALIITGSFAHAAGAESARLTLHETPKALPELAFADRHGKPVSLAELRGKTILLNIWATWCLPCRAEMPALDRLQARLGRNDFQVVALSIDRGGAEVVQRFYAEIGIRNLEIFTDSTGKIARDLGIVGVPVTLLLNRDGREIARAIGPVDWDDPKIIELISAQLSRGPKPALFPVPPDKHSAGSASP